MSGITFYISIILAGGNGAVGIALTIISINSNDMVTACVGAIASAIGFGLMGFLIGDDSLLP